MKQNITEKKYKILIIVNGSNLVFNDCILISDADGWIEFSDKFSKVFRYNKNNVISMEILS